LKNERRLRKIVHFRFGLKFTIYDNNGNKDPLQRKGGDGMEVGNQNETTPPPQKKREKLHENLVKTVFVAHLTTAAPKQT